jgi:hypothetical protein
MSCQDWFGSEGNPDVRQQYIDWIRGVVTGYNYANQDDQVALGRMPSDFALAIYVDNYCHSKRATSIAGAAFSLIGERRGSSVVKVLDDEQKAPPAKDGKAAQDVTESDAFRDWLARQSPDMRSLDKNILKNIYVKESAVQGK